MLPRQLATEYPPIHAYKRSPTVEVPVQSTNNCSVSDNNLISERDPSCFQGNYQLVLTFMLTSNKSVTWQPLHCIGPLGQYNADACHVTITCTVRLTRQFNLTPTLIYNIMSEIMLIRLARPEPSMTHPFSS